MGANGRFGETYAHSLATSFVGKKDLSAFQPPILGWVPFSSILVNGDDYPSLTGSSSEQSVSLSAYSSP